MADEFNFTPKVDKLIEEMNLEINEKIKNFPGNMLFNNKLHSIQVMLNLQFETACEKIMEKAKFYKANNNKKDFEVTIKQYENCFKPLQHILKEYRSINEISMKIFRDQNSYCFKDCYIKHGEKDEIKLCLRDCVDNFEKYSLPAFGNLYSAFLDEINENTMKTI